jgi:hypothetical protein
MANPFAGMGPPSFAATGGDAFSRAQASNTGSFYSPFNVNTKDGWAEVAQTALVVVAVLGVAWLATR